MLFGSTTNPPSNATYVLYEDTLPALGDVDLAVRNRLEKEGYEDGTPEYSKMYYQYSGEMQNTLPGMFEKDARNLKTNPNLGEVITVKLPDESAKDSIAKYTSMMGKGDNLVIMGHADTSKDPSYGGVPLSEWNIPDDVNCFLGACEGSKSGIAAANALGRPVVAQENEDFWSGTRKAAKTLTDAMFWDYITKETIGKTYLPTK